MLENVCTIISLILLAIAIVMIFITRHQLKHHKWDVDIVNDLAQLGWNIAIIVFIVVMILGLVTATVAVIAYSYHATGVMKFFEYLNQMFNSAITVDVKSLTVQNSFPIFSLLYGIAMDVGIWGVFVWFYIDRHEHELHPDIPIKGGKIFTVDDEHPHHESVAPENTDKNDNKSVTPDKAQ